MSDNFEGGLDGDIYQSSQSVDFVKNHSVFLLIAAKIILLLIRVGEGRQVVVQWKGSAQLVFLGSAL